MKMDSSNCKQYTWRLNDLFTSSLSYGLLLLNNSVTSETSAFLRKLWCNAQVRICVDGGTNGYHRIIQGFGSDMQRSFESDSHEGPLQSVQESQANGNDVHKTSAGTNPLCSKMFGLVTQEIACAKKSFLSNNSKGLQAMNGVPTCLQLSCEGSNSVDSVACKTESSALKNCIVPLPHFISGDFDSIKPDILQHYTDLGVEIVPTPDQDETDFTKALRQLDKHLLKQSQTVHHVLAAVSIGHDRFDHVLANINTLHKSPLSVPLLLVSPSSVLLLLSPGRHELVSPRYPAPHLNWCGYAPCAGPATVTTSGLKWDVTNTLVQFGGLVSTSNQFAKDCCSAFITTDQPLLFMFNRPPDAAPEESREDAAVQASAADLNGSAMTAEEPVSDT